LACFSNITERMWETVLSVTDLTESLISWALQEQITFYSRFLIDYWTDKYSCESVKGLGLIPGTVGRFDSSNGFRVPHIGWNALQITKDLGILDDVGNYHVYFVHSYRAMPVCFQFSFENLSVSLAVTYYSIFSWKCSIIWFISFSQSDDNNEWISSTCDYGDKFIASIRRGNVHAVQFHPEKSGGKFYFPFQSFSSLSLLYRILIMEAAIFVEISILH